MTRYRHVAAVLSLTLYTIAPSWGATPPASKNDVGDDVFQRVCAACHLSTAQSVAAEKAVDSTATALDARAVPREQLRQFTPEAILNALTNGKMRVQGSILSEAERRAVAEFASGKSLGVADMNARANRCKDNTPFGGITAARSWNGWGNGLHNTRLQPRSEGGLTAADLPKLKLKWAFGYANVSSARAQPAVVGTRVFVASENGEVHSLNAKSGCTYWTFKAQAGVRTALSVAPYTGAAGKQGSAVFFGDGKANAYAVDAQTGQQIWTRKLDEHKSAAITGAPAVYDGRLFVPVQGLNEEGQGATNNYPCCTFRGSLSALDASTGKVLWKTYTIAENKPRAKNKDGVQMYGPAGGGIWSAPTVDEKRGLVYVATGNGYADPAQPTTDAILALDIASGGIKWVQQVTSNDSWAMGCQAKNPDNPACPATLGPDYDFAAPPALTSVAGRDLLVIPQKSGLAYALDPDKQGAIVWQYRFGQGSGLGGQWGAAVDGEHAYFGVADLLTPTPGGMHAVTLTDGKPVWSVPPQKKLCGDKKGCSAGQGGALTVIPGAVLNAGLDGGLRAYSTADGRILWMFDMNRPFETVNGVEAKGGSMDGPGPVVADGLLYVNSGYGGLIGVPGNVLLVFGAN